jgi:metallophosphoesterase superfamily enzyme
LGDAVHDVFKVSARSVEAVAELLALADEVSALSGVFDSEAAELVGAGGEELFP